MQEPPPWGERRPEDERLFKQRTDDPEIVPDRVSPAIEGYFRIPPVWIGEAPPPGSVRVLNPSVHHAVVLRKKMHCGIEARVWRDGTFLFDFSSWQLAPMVEIPGYRRPAQGSHRIPPASTRAEDQAEDYAVVRAQVMNAHQACLTTSESVVKRRGAMVGFPVTAWNTLKAISFDAVNGYHDDPEDLHALARNAMNNKDRVGRLQPFSRRVLELDVVEHSLNLLDEILSAGDAVLVQIIETAYMAACRYWEKRYGEAVILAWGVCEQLVSSAWSSMLDDARASGTSRMPKDRRKKLISRDYTASVMIEMLEINGRINHDLYRLLEVARKARNRWAHELHVPKESEVLICIRAAQNLLRHIKRVQLVLQMGGRGGVPQWPIWMWEQVKSRRS